MAPTWCDLKTWLNGKRRRVRISLTAPDQTIGTSAEIVQLHKDSKVQISDVLSYHVGTATGQLIFSEIGSPASPVLWLNHDLVARRLLANSLGTLSPELEK